MVDDKETIEIIDDGKKCDKPSALASSTLTNGNNKSRHVKFAQPMSEKEKEKYGYKCTHCGIIFEHRDVLSAHSRIHADLETSTNVGDSKSSTSNVRPYSCTQCGQGFEFWAMLERHKAQHKETKGFKCSCGKTFINYTDLLYHSHTDEPEHYTANRGNFDAKGTMLPKPKSSTTSINSNYFYCEYCFKSFSDRHTLATHMYTHRGQDKKFTSSLGKLSTPSTTGYSSLTSSLGMSSSLYSPTLASLTSSHTSAYSTSSLNRRSAQLGAARRAAAL